MKKKIILLSLIFILILLGFFFFYKKGKTNKEDNNKEISLTSNFDINLLKLVNKEEKDNYLISPYSIKMALSLLKEGANGNTLDEINKVLKETNKINNKNVKIANALFIKNKYNDYIEKTFISNLQNKYKSEILIDEFKTPEVINNWVNKNTDGMIEKILDKMEDNFVLGLANAIAIDVKWQGEFECTNTTEEDFTNTNNETKKVQMMHNSYLSEDFKYIKSKSAEGIILPYTKDSNLEFIGLLPNKDINSYINTDLENDLTDLPKLQTSSSSKLHINLSIPRFSFKYSLENFKDILINMGIKDVFDINNANLTNIITKENLTKLYINNIYVDNAIHKTYIDFNESGTKAAAVTYFGVYASSAIMDDYKTIDIKFDKPFIAIIREKGSNEILFLGVVNNPNIWTGTTCSKEE